MRGGAGVAGCTATLLIVLALAGVARGAGAAAYDGAAQSAAIPPPSVPYTDVQLDEYHGLMILYNDWHGDEWAPWQRCSSDGSTCWADPDVHYCHWPHVHCMPSPVNETSTVRWVNFGDPYDIRDPGLRGQLSDAWVDRGKFHTWAVFAVLNAAGLTGPLPRVPPHVTHIRFNNCSFSGEVPSFAEQAQLRSLDLNHNRLSGELPDDLLRLHPSLEVLSAADNQLSGAFPAVACESLEVIKLGQNLLEELPANFTGLFPKVGGLDVAHNKLTVLPQLCAPGGNLKFLTAENNMISTMGTWTDCKDMSKLDLSSNKFHEPLPELFRQSPDVQVGAYINLSQNRFFGTISEATMCLAMTLFNVNDNELTGELQLCPFGLRAQVFLVSHNQLSGVLPQHLFDLAMRSLNVVDLSYNNFEGTIDAHALSVSAYQGSTMSVNLAHNPLVRADRVGRNSLGGGIFKVDLNGESNQYMGLVPWYCHRITFTGAEYVTLTVDPEVFYYEHCRCLKGYVGVPPNDCIECPPNGDCESGGSVVRWGKGFFPVLRSDNGTEHLVTLEPCLDHLVSGDSCCPSGDCHAEVTDVERDDSWCGNGMSGHMCAKCHCSGTHDCLFWNDVRCEPCDRPYFIVSIVIVCVTLVAVLVIGAVTPIFQKRRRERVKNTMYNNAEVEARNQRMRMRVRMLAMQTVTLSFAQMIYPMARRISKRSTGMNRTAQLLQWTHFMPTGGAPCVDPAMADPVNEMIFVIFVPVIVLSVLAILAFFRSMHVRMRSSSNARALLSDVNGGGTAEYTAAEEGAARKESEDDVALANRGVQDLKDGGYPILDHEPSAFEWWARWSLRALNVMYFALVDKTMSTFHCTSDDTGDSYLSSRPYFACDIDGEWGRLVALGVVSLVVYVLGIPLLMGALLHRYAEHMERPAVNYILGPLVRLFQRKARLHQVLILLRRLVVATLLSFLSLNDSWQAIGLTFVLVLALVEQVVRSPFRSTLANRMEVLSLVVLLNMSTIMHSNRDTSAVNITLALNWITMSMMAFALAHEYWLLAAAVAVEKQGFVKISRMIFNAPQQQ